MRFVNSQANRRMNCDLANTDKIVATSMKQIENINKVKDLGLTFRDEN